jgi:hypothetical protein
VEVDKGTELSALFDISFPASVTSNQYFLKRRDGIF